MLRCPFIFSALYMLKPNRWQHSLGQIHLWSLHCIADTSRQSYMHMIACGIRHHQNWRIGPSLFGRERTVGILNSTEDIVKILKHICDYRSIYPQWVEFEFIRTVGVYQCTWRDKLFEEKITLFWRTLREVIILVIDNDWMWIWTLNSSYTSGWIDTTTPSLYIYIVVGEWYRSHFCGRSPCLRCTSCTRRRVQSAEKRVWPLLPSTSGLPDYYIVLLGCQK